MSGTVTARDIWLLADVPLCLALQEPPWCGLPVSRDVLMRSNTDALHGVDLLSYFHALCEHYEVTGRGRARSVRTR